MTAYKQLLEAGRTQNVHTVEIREMCTGKEGVTNIHSDGMVSIFYGADDGSDDATITADDFNQHFEITRIISD